MFLNRKHWLGVLGALTLPLIAWGQSSNPGTHQNAVITNDFFNHIWQVAGPIYGDKARFIELISACDKEFVEVHEKINLEWYARTEAPTTDEVATQHVKIAQAMEKVKIKYLALVCQQLLSEDQKKKVTVDQLTTLGLSSVIPNEEQKAKVRVMAEEIMAQITEPPEYENLFKSQLAALRVRVKKQLLSQSAVGSPTTAPSQMTEITDNTKTKVAMTQRVDPGHMKYHDNKTQASNPGKIILSQSRLIELEPMLATLPPEILSAKFYSVTMQKFNEHMQAGDSRAAVVVKINPLLVASYSDDLDAVVILQFPQWLVKKHNLEVGSRLLAVNTFSRVVEGTDIVRGPKALHPYKNVFPIIADFICDDIAQTQKPKAAIPEAEWEHCLSLGKDYREQFPTRVRNGSPLLVEVPGK